ncbi:MAG: FAD-linked oxidase C-terminal domain-containing protein [Thermodesulfobacteriota bacterium]
MLEEKFNCSVIGLLVDIFGKDSVLSAKEDRLSYSYDATGEMFLPDAVVFASSAKEISKLLKLANREGFPVTTRGAGSGFTGGSLPLEGGVVLSTERMNSIIEIDDANLVATVEPGVVNFDLQDAVKEVGLFYPPDPTSLRFSTIGGNIAECAGGPRGIKYGVTKDYVLGLDLVLPTGEMVSTGVKTMKGVVGYDLTKLIVGSEGTLAVITRAYLKLIPLPEKVRTLLAVFPTIKDAATAVSAITKSRLVPSTLEFIDRICVDAVKEHSDFELPDGAEAVLLIEVDGESVETEKAAATVTRSAYDSNAIEVTEASGKKETRRLWEARRAVSPSLKKIKPDKLNEDVVVPRSRIPELIEGVESIANDKDVIIACFGHAGDGNIHVNVMIDKGEPGEEERGLAAVKDIFSLTLRLEGTISGEHGIGTAKAPYLAMELGPEVIGIMKGIKKLFDPNNILNPGKIFDLSGKDGVES